jgi:5-methylcytosine-specific restriction endonuclease McrA
MSNRPTAAQRQEVSRRAGWLCEYCRSQEKYSNSTFEVEHIIPLVKGGLTTLINLAFSCAGCNKHKAQRISAWDKITHTEAPFYHPREDVWEEHFAWSQDFTGIIELTATGRVTVAELKLNRQPLVNLRRVLAMAGEHPPGKQLQ